MDVLGSRGKRCLQCDDGVWRWGLCREVWHWRTTLCRPASKKPPQRPLDILVQKRSQDVRRRMQGRQSGGGVDILERGRLNRSESHVQLAHRWGLGCNCSIYSGVRRVVNAMRLGTSGWCGGGALHDGEFSRTRPERPPPCNATQLTRPILPPPAPLTRTFLILPASPTSFRRS
jgi:hypothetical protein